MYGNGLYFLIISAVYSFVLVLFFKRAQKNSFDLKIALTLTLLVLIVGFIGARLTHVFYELPLVYMSYPHRIFYFWEGGFVYYGGLWSAFFAGTIYLHLKKQKVLDWANLIAPFISLGYGLGRISCLYAGCCYGSTCDLPWAIAGRHPTQLYALIMDVSIAIFLIRREKQNYKDIVWIWLILHGLSRLVMEHFRDDFRGSNILGLSISSLISIIMISIGIAFWHRACTSVKNR